MVCIRNIVCHRNHFEHYISLNDELLAAPTQIAPDPAKPEAQRRVMDGSSTINRPKAKNMQNEIKTISLPLPFRMGSVNCYLIETGAGYVLIDTGGSNSRKELVRELESAGCKPGLLKLIVLTHGDFDHTGNAAYLRNTFGGKIAMHMDDSGHGRTWRHVREQKETEHLHQKLASHILRVWKFGTIYA